MYLVGTLVGGCRCVSSYCSLGLAYDLVIVTMSLTILSGLFIGLDKV